MSRQLGPIEYPYVVSGELLPRSLISRIAVRAGKMAAGATLSSSVLAGIGLIAHQDPTAMFDEAAVVFQEKLTSCDSLYKQDVDYFSDRLNEGFTKKRAIKPGQKITAPQPRNYGLETAEVKQTLDDMMATDDPEAVIDMADAFAQAHYGFEIEAYGAPDEKDRSDVIELVSHLGTIPTKLVRATSEDDLDKVGVGEPIKEPSVAEYTPGNNKIAMKPGKAQTIGHELGHAFRRTASRDTCTMPTIYTVPDFEAANPPSFEYGKSKWENVTFDEHGSDNAGEDYATTAEELFNTQPRNQACLEGTDKQVLKRKLAIVATDLERTVPGSGKYYIDKLVYESHCSR